MLSAYATDCGGLCIDRELGRLVDLVVDLLELSFDPVEFISRILTN